ncbi:MAG: bacteriophage abortive infection AbiH family protein [Clostridium baratii]|uniref:bacteriophage abortive infection AbiH family protein n=1 Tax=Clostridium baratii TaxID=1561 RepID=UPI00242D477F|nr:bacteriophage abortive infection AbiH family protein [Clostridium baratii]MBS6006907.1 bacteriophage abortive infection AbiH family protein [Clostridium baratii]
MKLFIIGNGFDIGHDLKTSYWDFRTFLHRSYSEFLYEFESNYNIYPNFTEDEKKEMLWNDFEMNLANIDEDIIIENAVSIDMGLESGDIGIEDTLRDYFSEQFEYINKLPHYLKLWVRSIRIRDAIPKTKFINCKNDDIYLTFNYTSVLENVYKIREDKIIHIHGSLRESYGEPKIGHGNDKKIQNIKIRYEKACEIFDEKEASISKVIENYYRSTYKDVKRYMIKLLDLKQKNIDEIIVIGHSLADVDMPYLEMINILIGSKAIWNVYYYDENKKEQMYDNLIKYGIKKEQIKMDNSINFFD